MHSSTARENAGLGSWKEQTGSFCTDREGGAKITKRNYAQVDLNMYDFGQPKKDTGTSQKNRKNHPTHTFLYRCQVRISLSSVLLSFLFQRIPVVYFEKEEFAEIEAFMQEVSETYGFEFQRYAMSYKDGMQDLVDSRGTEVWRS